MTKQKYVEDFRNYDKEAVALLVGLTKTQIYDLYEIVIGQQQKAQSDTRRKELEAVQRAIENKTGLDVPRMRGIKNGYKSEMARDARAKDGSTKPNRKKV